MNPEILSIGPFAIHWYGLLIVGGAVLAAWIATIEAKRRGENPDHIWNMLIWVLIFGIIGARLYHVFSDPVGGVGWSYYREHPIDIVNFWNGGFRGLGIYGGILGGFIGMVLYVVTFNRGHDRRLRQARALLERYREVVGEALTAGLLTADISTLGGIADQTDRVAALRARLERSDGWNAAALAAVADVFAEGPRPLFDGSRRQRLAEATALLKRNRGLVGSALADGLLSGDVSTKAGREAQKELVAQLKEKLSEVEGWGQLELDKSADVFAERRLVLARWLDCVAPGLLLAQAIGRMGNRINQELYGPPTDLPWGFKINPANPYQVPVEMLGRTRAEVEAYIAETRFHPTFYYEALWNLVGFALIMVLGRRYQNRLRDGDIILLYLIWYPLGRIIVEMFRPDAWVTGVPGLATAQIIGLGMIALSLILLYLRHRNWSPPKETGEPVPQVVDDISQEASS